MTAGLALAAAQADIGWAGLATSSILVLVAVGLSMANRLGIERSILWASVRAVVQLLAVGVVLAFVLEPSRPLALAFVWVLAMVVIAAVTVHRRIPEVPGAGPLAFTSIGAATVVGLAVMVGLGVFPLEGRTIIPLSGMIVGNTMASVVVLGRRLVAEVSEKRAEIEARLALGQPWQEAGRPSVRSALKTALLPGIERTKVVGLVALPGAMTGLILAGVPADQAVKVQAAVLFQLIGAEAAAVSVVAVGISRRLFTPDHRLVRIDRTEA